jgi:hypothetical protein
MGAATDFFQEVSKNVAHDETQGWDKMLEKLTRD